MNISCARSRGVGEVQMQRDLGALTIGLAYMGPSSMHFLLREYVHAYALDAARGARIGVVEFRGCSGCSVAASVTVLSSLSANREAILASIDARAPAGYDTSTRLRRKEPSRYAHEYTVRGRYAFVRGISVGDSLCGKSAHFERSK